MSLSPNYRNSLTDPIFPLKNYLSLRFQKHAHVVAIVVRDLIFPAFVDDPDPFVRKGTDGLVVAHSLLPCLDIESPGPAAVLGAFVRPFVEALANEPRKSSRNGESSYKHRIY